MTDLHTAAKQAVEALKDYKRSDDDRLSIAMHTLRQALEQPAQQEQGDSICQEDDGCPTELAVLQRFWRGQPIPDEHHPAWFKPAQQEPVAYSYTSRITGAQGFSHHPMPRFIDSESWDIKPLYTRPQAREPLTDDEIHDIYDEVARREPYNMAVTRRNIARAIEAAHGIKERP